MGKDSDITSISEASLWAELVRRGVEREKTGEASVWPKVTLAMVMGGRPSLTLPEDVGCPGCGITGALCARCEYRDAIDGIPR